MTFRQDCEALDHRNHKCRRLPCTGLRTPNYVPALKSWGNGLGLNGSGNQQPRCSQISQKRLGQTEGVKTRVNKGIHCTILSV